MDNIIQSRLKLFSLLETHLRKAAAEVKPLMPSQLFAIPDIHRASGGELKEVLNILRQFSEKGVLVDFSEPGKKFPYRSFTWKDDLPAPKYAPQNRRTREERRAAEQVDIPPVKPKADLFSAMGSGHVLNKPVGQETGYQEGQLNKGVHAAPMTDASACQAAMVEHYGCGPQYISFDDAFKWSAAWLAAKSFYKEHKQ